VKGCVVSNAHPELQAFAEAQVAKGDAAHIFQVRASMVAGTHLRLLCMGRFFTILTIFPMW
jgi:hypothetical protein